MNTSATYTKLVNVVKTLSMDDCVWLMHIMHKEEMEYKYKERILNSDEDLLENDVNLLNSLHNISEVKSLMLNEYKDFDDHYIEKFIDSINCYITSTTFRSLDLLKYKTNKRFLNFTLYKLEQELKNKELKIQEIKNSYLRFIYITSVFDNTDRFLENLNRIERTFSNIMLEKPLHFKNYDYIDFYRWVIQYLKENRRLSRRFNLKDYCPIQDSDFKDTVLSIFDKIYDEDKNAYSVLKDKISNAWYQKAYRQKNKGKEHRYYFTDKANESLKIMAAKEDLTEEKMLEKLIHQHYSTLYVNQISGKDLYSLT
jgi:hypothetical protein